MSVRDYQNVLIDTWWNVNGETSSFGVRGFCVLIDTWWNVNLKRGYITQQELERFNRYMVECEFTYDSFKKIVQIVLIDTWWNVNDVNDGDKLSADSF